MSAGVAAAEARAEGGIAQASARTGAGAPLEAPVEAAVGTLAPAAHPVSAPASFPAARSTALIFCAWTGVGLLLAQQSYVLRVAAGGSPVWWRLVVYSVAGAWLWAAATPLVVWLARRFRPQRPHLARAVLLHVGAMLALNLIDSWGTILRAPIVGNAPRQLWIMVALSIFSNASLYLGIAGVAVAMDYARLYRERAVAAAELAAQLSQAHLRALQSQLRPHFLFNTLNAIAEQGYADPATADRMTTRLAALLRASLTLSDRPEVPLEDELRALAPYLDIMAIRHKGRLSVEIDVDPALGPALVPSMVLQPIVENAIHHGAEPSERPSRVVVRASREGERGDRLRLVVTDDGVGLPAGGVREGIGLGNTRERLRRLYGGAASLRVAARAEGGVASEIVLPYRAG